MGAGKFIFAKLSETNRENINKQQWLKILVLIETVQPDIWGNEKETYLSCKIA